MKVWSKPPLHPPSLPQDSLEYQNHASHWSPERHDPPGLTDHLADSSGRELCLHACQVHEYIKVSQEDGTGETGPQPRTKSSSEGTRLGWQIDSASVLQNREQAQPFCPAVVESEYLLTSSTLWSCHGEGPLQRTLEALPGSLCNGFKRPGFNFLFYPSQHRCFGKGDIKGHSWEYVRNMYIIY